MKDSSNDKYEMLCVGRDEVLQEDEREEERPVCPYCGEEMVSVSYYDNNCAFIFFWMCGCGRPEIDSKGNSIADILLTTPEYTRRVRNLNKVLKKAGIKKLYLP